MPSKQAKTRKHNRKRAHAELSASKTEASRARRLDNKAKRDEIHDIDPNAKVKIIGQKIYIDIGYLVEVIMIDGAIVTIPIPDDIDEPAQIVKSSLPEGAIKTECDYEDAVIEYQEVMDAEKPDCKLPVEKKSWKQVLREWSNS